MTDMKTSQQKADEAGRKPDRGADDWWWVVVTNPNREIHLFELGYAEEVEPVIPEGASAAERKRIEAEPKATTALTPDRLSKVMASLGATPDVLGSDPAGWTATMAPGRPDRHLEPKAYDHFGDLLPFTPRAGVTLHLLDDYDSEHEDQEGDDSEDATANDDDR